MQGIDAAETLALDEGDQRGKCGVGTPAALLRPRHQNWLQKLGQTLMRQCTEAGFGAVEIARHRGVGAQQQLRGGVVRQLLRKPHGVGPAIHQAGQKRLLQEFAVIRGRGIGLQKVASSPIEIALADGKATREVGSEAAVSV